MSKGAESSPGSMNDLNRIRLTADMYKTVKGALHVIEESIYQEGQAGSGYELKSVKSALLEEGYGGEEYIGPESTIGSRKYRGDSLIGFLFEDLVEASEYISLLGQEDPEMEDVREGLQDRFDRSEIIRAD